MYLRRAVRIVNGFLIYIPLLALSGIWIITSTGESSAILSILLMILSTLLYAVVYGRLVEVIAGFPRTTWRDRLSTHFCNCFSLTLIMHIPLLFISYFSGMGLVKETITANIGGALLNCLALYVWPLIFITKTISVSISVGLTTLFRELRQSILIILLTLFIFIIKIVVKLAVLFIVGIDNITKIISVGFLQNIITNYIGLIIFAIATMILMSKKEGNHNYELMKEFSSNAIAPTGNKL